MPEYPDIVVYIESLERRVLGARLTRIRLLNPFVLRSVSPPIDAVNGKRVMGFRRMGKRIVVALEDELFIVLHLMIAGRLRWLEKNAKPPGKIALAAFEFDHGVLVMTEAGSKRRASLHLARGEAALAPFDMAGLEIMQSDLAAFSERLTRENHTLKRALTDPRGFSGIGNAYSDEILHRAKLSPIALTQRLSATEIQRLFLATRDTLNEWAARLRQQTGEGFPQNVTAFRPEMAVHGRFGQPCPICAAPVQRIVYAANETNYCARCQTDGVILADRALSRLLKKSWPKSLEDLE
jgi:formamidopyrimidine-DNA glycosylase